MNQPARFQIDAGIPIPDKSVALRKYPFAEMGIGDSFLCGGRRSAIATAASTYGKANGKRFATRQTPDGIRVWRVS